jgi:glycosyltransferase involved in cell wall biosynthesis
VVIGRNEGERLKRCLSSIQSQHSGPVIYVDSGSTDGSAAHARSVGVDVVDLDISIPFTMARGRNAGFDYLVEHYPDCEYVQFVDGDCEVATDWIKVGLQYLQDYQAYGAVCGNRHERFPDASIYNQLINMEWQGSEGEVAACGGDAIYRIVSFKAAGCFNESMIAGEEADLCLRIRRQDSRLMRLDNPMTIHDANMQHFSQWWRRSVRCGHAYAQGYDLHKHDSEEDGKSYKKKPLLSSLVYGLALPILLVITILMLILSSSDLGPLSLLGLLVIVFALYIRVATKAAGSKSDNLNSIGQRWLYAGFIVLGKLPEAQGVLRYYLNKALGKTSKIIEYKVDNKQEQGSHCSLKD